LENLKVGLVGRADHDNFGDSLMFAFYVYYLTDLNNMVFIVEPSDVFMSRFHEIGIKCTSIKLEDCGQLDKVIFVGGGYFGQPDLNQKKWLKSFEEEGYFYKIAKILKKLQVDYYIHGVEVGPLDSKNCRSMVKDIISNSSGTIVRNLASREFVKNELGLDSIFLRDVVLEVTRLFSNAHNISSTLTDKKSLVIHGTGKFFKTNFISGLFRKRILELVRKCEFSKVSIVFDQTTYPELIEVAEKYSTVLSKKLNIPSEVINYTGIIPLLEVIESCSHVLTTKLHLGVVGLSYGKQVFCISGMAKNKRFYNEVFEGKGIEGLFKAILVPSVIKNAHFVSGEQITLQERNSSESNISKLSQYLTCSKVIGTDKDLL
jgi:polysaccharide pyruvyl transferase WcaK-like protein